jgi:hypothetical protein
MEYPLVNAGDHDPTIHAIERVTETLGGPVGHTVLGGPDFDTGNRPSAELEVPANIHDLLDRGLTDAGMSGAATRKCRIAGHPDLLARYVPGSTIEDVSGTLQSIRTLDLPITPTVMVEHADQPHLITKIVDGVTVESLLPTASPDLFAEVDATWANLIQKLITAFQTGIKWPLEVEGPEQWMFGTLHGDVKQRLWLADIPHATRQLDAGEYGYEVLYPCRALYDMEQLSGARMERARHALVQAIAICPDSKYNGDALRNAALYCLENNINPYIIDDDPDFLEAMRIR